MKFVALALALLLAVGSQAASLQADAPSQLAHFRAAADVYLDQVKETAKRALSHLDDAEYGELKNRLNQRLDDAQAQIKALRNRVSPITDSVVSTIADATADFRASVASDLETLKTELEPKRAKLREVIEQHIEEYRAHLQPIINEYYTKHTAEMDALKAKLEPALEELRTKAALMPILEAVRTKATHRLENLKEMVTPYVEEYKEQAKQAYSQAQTINADELNALREKIAPLVEDIKTKVYAVFEAIAATVTKS
uniref:Apolipoprotein A-Ib n=1 Tax=Anabas testudineus TaxID=64144 RepID=A0AAQ6INK6_ANATE